MLQIIHKTEKGGSMRKDFKTDTWEEFNKMAFNAKIILFGASGMGKRIIKDAKKYNSSWNIIGFSDNNSEKWGTMFEGYPVIPPQEIKKYTLDSTIVLITSTYPGSIGKQLYDMGIRNYYSAYWLDDSMRDYYIQDIDERHINTLMDLLSDKQSKEVLHSIVEKRKTGFMDYTDIKTSEEEYFIDSIFTHTDQEVFIDGGGYDGDTIEAFIKWTKGSYKRIYTFEPDTQILDKLKENLYKYDNRVKLFEAGLSDKNSKAFMKETDGIYSGKITQEDTGARQINILSLDSTIKEPVTFIKMDIEGSELNALEGARNIILNDKPKLAICIYHRLNDLWEIPCWIHNLVPEYNLYIRHHGKRCYSTILYATL